jgi:hypothetical protein
MMMMMVVVVQEWELNGGIGVKGRARKEMRIRRGAVRLGAQLTARGA